MILLADTQQDLCTFGTDADMAKSFAKEFNRVVEIRVDAPDEDEVGLNFTVKDVFLQFENLGDGNNEFGDLQLTAEQASSIWEKVRPLLKHCPSVEGGNNLICDEILDFMAANDLYE